jgi:hypothetical protein
MLVTVVLMAFPGHPVPNYARLNSSISALVRTARTIHTILRNIGVNASTTRELALQRPFCDTVTVHCVKLNLLHVSIQDNV